METEGQKVLEQGAGLQKRLGSSNSPSKEEREAFAREEKKWRLVVEWGINHYTKEMRDEAVQALKRLLGDPAKPGPKLDQIKQFLGV